MEMPKIIKDIKDKITDPELRHDLTEAGKKVVDAVKDAKEAVAHSHTDTSDENDSTPE